MWQKLSEQLATRGALAAGAHLGPHAIVSEIGAGGMGAVYLAERVDGYRASGWRAYWAEELAATLKADALRQAPQRRRERAMYVAELYLRVGQVDDALDALKRALKDR